MRGLYIARRGDAALVRAFAEMGCRVLSVKPAEALWAIKEEPDYSVIVYEAADIDVPSFTACAEAKPAASVMLAILSDNRAGTRAALLRAGADICTGRPLSFLELQALLHARSRWRLSAPADKKSAKSQPTIDVPHAPLILNCKSHRVAYQDRPIDLSAQDFRLLMALAEAPGQTLDRPSIWSRVWNDEAELNSEAIELAVSRLRRKLKSTPVRVLSLRGVGYRLIGTIQSA